MNENIEQILKLNLTDEQKEALLGQLANEILEKNQIEKDSFDERLEKLKAKEKQKTEALKKRLAEYEERSLRKENQRKRDEELEEKLKALSEITNARGEKIYLDLDDLSGYEIDKLYNDVIEKAIEENEPYQVSSNDEEKAIEENEPYQVSSNNEEKANVEKIRDQSLEESNKVVDLANRMGPLTNAKSLEGISEKTDDSINNNENFRELTYKEARSIVNYGNSLNNGELSEEEIIKYKPRLDDLMKETGAQDMNELYEKAREVVNKNKSNINGSIEKQAEFINKKDVSELNEEEKNHIRETLGLDDDEEITNDDLSKVQAEDVANSKEKRKPAKKISIAGEKLKEKIEKNGPKILKTVGAVVLVGVAIATGFALAPGLAAGALGFSAYQEFNKGKKL